MHQTNHPRHVQNNASGICQVAGLVTVTLTEEMTQASPTFQQRGCLHSCQLPKGDGRQIALAASVCFLLEELERCIDSSDMPDCHLIIHC
jgi:formate dehydrogenase assembly factor FdhD